MQQQAMLLLAIYLLGFSIPQIARSWKALFWASGSGIVFVIFLALLISIEGSFMVFVLGPAVLLLAVGVISGGATRAVVLAIGANRKLYPQLIVTALGAVVLPGSLVARDHYRDWASQSAYAQLPSSSSWDGVPGCKQFASAGPLLDTIVTSDKAQATGLGRPKVRYPLKYLELPPPRFPGAMEQQSQLRFSMHIGDARPVRQSEITGPDGHWISYEKPEPAVSFRLLDREKIKLAAAKSLGVALGRRSSADLGKLQLEVSQYPGLQRIADEPVPSALYKDQFVGMQGDTIVELVQCNEPRSVPNPICQFQFDIQGAPVDGHFRLVSLSEWPRIKDHISRFVECALGASIFSAEQG